MQITIKRTGGYAGFDQTLVSKDLGSLPARKRKAILRRLKDLSLQVAAADAPVGADMLTYEVEAFEVPDVPEHLSVVDTGEPGDVPVEQVNQLIEALT